MVKDKEVASQSLSGLLPELYCVSFADTSRNEQAVVSSPRIGLEQVFAGLSCQRYPRSGRIQLCQQSGTSNAHWYGKRGGNGGLKHIFSRFCTKTFEVLLRLGGHLLCMSGVWLQDAHSVVVGIFEHCSLAKFHDKIEFNTNAYLWSMFLCEINGIK